ncbi:hypothetical protein PEBR_42412 [Penicillium brasilianum]|uniref:Cell surface protein n=1 Tax=Penicillium brasilianum TaxID=104259 RepID=A0A1S9R961_PENBI|nr:hypothetical protein PEBR_42412 [Penicillium brasilianum]
MSNIMHKVKDAMTENHDRDRAPNTEGPETHHTYRSSNPYAKDPASQNNPSTMNPESGSGNTFGLRGQGTAKEPDTFDSTPGGRTTHGLGSQGAAKGTDTYESTPGGRTTHGLRSQGAAKGPDTYGSTTTGGNTVNAGPHDSKLANKLDPRVDSDLDHRAQNAGTMGSQNVGAAPQGMNTGNTAASGQPRAFGSDHHRTDEDNHNKANQEHKLRTEPGPPGTGSQVTSEESYNSSSQEHKSHSTTTHTAPCDQFGGGAAGGSSYTQPPVGETAGMQNTNRAGKVDPQAQGMGYQQGDLANQRSGY